MTDEEFAELEERANGPASYDTLLQYANEIERRYQRSTAPVESEPEPQQVMVTKAIVTPPPQPEYVTHEYLQQALDFMVDMFGEAIGKVEQLQRDENKFNRDALEQLRRHLIDKTNNELSVLRGTINNKSSWKKTRRDRASIQ